MTDCKPTPEFEDLVRKMARNRYANGVTDRRQVVDAIHAAIGDATPAWKNEIADIVHAEIGEHLTLSEAQTRLSNARNEVRKLASTPQNATRRAALERDIERLKSRMASGDYAKPKRARYQYSDETMALLAERERVKQQLDHDIRMLDDSRRTPLFKGMKLTTGIMRDAILTSPTVFAHLLGASGWRAVSTALEDAIGGALHATSKRYRAISDLAPTEGGGFNVRAQADALRGAFSKETLKAMRDKLVKGSSDRQALYGESHTPDYWFLGYPGRAHDMIKTPIEQHAFYRSVTRQETNMRRMLEKSGRSPEEIDRVLATDTVSTAIEARAYADSQAAKLQGNNKVVDAYNNGLRMLEKSGDWGAAFATMLRFETPIVRIPANYIAEVGSYLAGGAKAASRSRSAKLAGGITADDADYIVRNIKKQSVGLGLMALGYLGYEHLGGLYRPMKDGPNKEIPVGDLKIDGVEVGHHWLHSPMIGVLQAAALAHYAADEDLRKSRGNTALAGALAGGVATALSALALDVPVFQVAKDIQKISQGQAGRVAGDKVTQVAIPGAVQWYARHEDVDSRGEPIRRRPKNFADEIKMAIPGYREEVPRK